MFGGKHEPYLSTTRLIIPPQQKTYLTMLHIIRAWLKTFLIPEPAYHPNYQNTWQLGSREFSEAPTQELEPVCDLETIRFHAFLLAERDGFQCPSEVYWERAEAGERI